MVAAAVSHTFVPLIFTPQLSDYITTTTGRQQQWLLRRRFLFTCTHIQQLTRSFFFLWLYWLCITLKAQATEKSRASVLFRTPIIRTTLLVAAVSTSAFAAAQS